LPILGLKPSKNFEDKPFNIKLIFSLATNLTDLWEKTQITETRKQPTASAPHGILRVLQLSSHEVLHNTFSVSTFPINTLCLTLSNVLLVPTIGNYCGVKQSFKSF